MAQIYGELIRAQLQSSASDLTPTATGLLYFNTTTGLKWHNGSDWKIAADLDSAQTLSAKALDATCSLAGNAATATTAANISGSNFTGDISNTDNSMTVDSVGGKTSAEVASGVTASLLATSSNTADTIVKRDASGNFATNIVHSSAAATGALKLPSGTEAERPTAETGMVRHNSDTNSFEGYANGSWAAIGGGSGSGINYLADLFEANLAPTTTSVAAISTTNTDYSNFLVSSAGGTLTRDTTSVVRGANSYKFVPTASGEFFGLPAFQLASVDLGKALSIKFDLKNDGVAADWDVVVCRYNSSGVHQETVVVAGTASSGTPASAQLPTGLTSFRGFFITGSDATDYYRLFVRHLTSATDAVYLDTLVVGPEAVMEGAIVTDWESYTPIVTAATTNPTLTATAAGRWRRVGDSIEILFSYYQSSAGTAGVGQYYFSPPDGIEMDVNKSVTSGNSTAGFGYGQVSLGGSSNLQAYPFVYSDGRISLMIDNSVAGITSFAHTSPYNFGATNPRIVFHAKFPVAGWSANTQMAARAVEEFVSHNGTSQTYGPAGAVIPTTTPSGIVEEYTINLPSTVNPTDSFIVEINKGSDAWIQPNAAQGVEKLRYDGTNYIGADFYWNGTVLKLVRGKYRSGTSTTWASITAGTKWRLRKVSGGAAVGFPVSARNVIGDTSGTAVPTGYVGEYIESTGANSGTLTSNVAINAHSITLQAGDWDVWGMCVLSVSGADSSTVKRLDTSISTTSTTLGDPYQLTSYGQRFDLIGFRQQVLPRRILIDSPTTVYLVARMFNISGTTGTAIIALPTIFARRRN